MRRYLRCYVDCHRWLIRVFPPWDWMLGALLLPGSSMYRLQRTRGALGDLD